METNEIKQQKKNNNYSFDKILFTSLLLFFIFSSSILIAGGWLYYTLTQTDNLPKYLSEKLSKPGKYTVKIESLKNTFPIITGNNISYNSLNRVSSLSFNIKELVVYPDYINPEIGTHSFEISSATLLFRRPKFTINSEDIELFGKYSQKQIYIGSSTWKLFGGNAYITGHVDTSKKPAAYNLYGELYHVRLQDILARTKNKGTFTGKIFGSVKLNNIENRTTPPFGMATLSVYEGTYYKPELVDKINSALHKIGLQSKLKNLAETVASSSFVLKGDFLIDGKTYVTENAVIMTPWSRIKFSGIIGPKSALNGTFVINYKDYSSFVVRVYGSNSKNLNYKISDRDKAQLASILFREVSRGTGRQMKDEGRRTNRKFNFGLDRLGRKTKKFLKDL